MKGLSREDLFCKKGPPRTPPPKTLILFKAIAEGQWPTKHSAVGGFGN